MLRQTEPADEIIVVDDGSTDDTGERIRSRYPQVRYIRQDNAGVSSARNRGIREAAHEWIAFLDSDDEWLPEKLARQKNVLWACPDLQWVTANFKFSTTESYAGRPKLEEFMARQLLQGKVFFDNYFRTCVQDAEGCTDTMLIRRDLLMSAGLFQEGMQYGEDLDLWWRIAYLDSRVGFVPEVLAIYHIGVPDSLAKKESHPERLRELLSKHVLLSKQFDRYPDFKPCAQELLRYWIHFYLKSDHIHYVRSLITEFDDILPAGYKAQLRLLTIWPNLTTGCMPLLTWLNKFLHFRL